MKIRLPLFLAVQVILSLSLSAQSPPVAAGQTSATEKPAPSAPAIPFSSVIGAVLNDFPQNLEHISGELLLAEGGSENYSSRLELPGSLNCSVTRYHSNYDTSASWQAKMPVHEEFEKAAREYQELYRKLQTCTLQLADGTVLYLKGKWEPARENIPFTTSSLRLTTAYGPYRNVNVELELVYQVDAWAININIYNKDREEPTAGVNQ